MVIVDAEPVGKAMKAIPELIDARGGEEGIAIRFRGGSITYREVAERSRALAALLESFGIGAGTRLGLLMGNRPEWLVTAIAAARSGALLFPLSTFLKERELEDALRRGEIEAVVCSPFFAGVAYEKMLPEVFRGLFLPWPDGAELPGLARGALADRRPTRPAADPAIVFHTSGTTGEPKGVVHAHGPIVRHAAAIAARMGLGADDRSWSTFPFFFSAGLMIFAYPAFAAGATLVLQEKFEPGEGLRLLEEERCTMVQAWPHQVEAMMAERRFAHADLSRVRKGNGAKFLPLEAFLRHPHDAIDGWGMTETLTYCSATRFDDPLEVRLASHGLPLEGVEIRVVDPETGEPLSPGSDGELSVRGCNLMRGYLGEPPDSHLDVEGFFRSGDLGRVDGEGHVHFLGRLKEVIKTAGVNVSAAEVEKLLAEHPAVETAYAVGVPDPSRGERIAAFVVRSGACDEAELKRFATERTARHKVPRWIFFLERDQVPQTGTGKVLKSLLRETAIERCR